MRVQVVAKWARNETLPPQLPGFKRVAFQLLGTLDTGVGLRELLDSIRSRAWSIPELAIDLASLAFSVYAADMGVPRSLSQDSWTREISLDVPVSAPSLWESQRGTLTQLLNYLTGDRWFVAFRSRDAAPDYNENVDTSEAAECPTISLFSGGLDSLVGAIDLLEQDKTQLLCVSHAGDGLTSGVQHEVLEDLQKTYPERVEHLRIWYAPKSLLKKHATEKTTRGRSFLFFAAAAVAAATQATNKNSIEVLIPENGFISLNVPLDPLRLGAHSTRTTHPFVLRLWNELLKGLELNVTLRNPYQFMTKGEMFKQCANKQLLKELLPQTMSCSSPTKARWHELPPQHCGHCVPCIIRRAAVQKAFGSDTTKYTVTFKKSVDPTTSEGRNVRAFQRAIEVNSDKRVASIIVHSAGPLPREPGFAEIYMRGLSEVKHLVGNVVTKPKT